MNSVLIRYKRWKLLLVLAILCNYSCDVSYPIRGELINESNDTLTISVNNDVRYVAPGSTFDDFYTTYTKKNPKKNFKCCPCEFDYVKIYAKNAARQLTKDYQSKDSWEIDKSDLKKDKKIYCRIYITRDDVN